MSVLQCVCACVFMREREREIERRRCFRDQTLLSFEICMRIMPHECICEELKYSIKCLSSGKEKN